MSIQHRELKEKIVAMVKKEELTAKEISLKLGVGLPWTTALLRKMMEDNNPQIESRISKTNCGKYDVRRYKFYQSPIGARKILFSKGVSSKVDDKGNVIALSELLKKSAAETHKEIETHRMNRRGGCAGVSQIYEG